MSTSELTSVGFAKSRSMTWMCPQDQTSHMRSSGQWTLFPEPSLPRWDWSQRSCLYLYCISVMGKPRAVRWT